MSRYVRIVLILALVLIVLPVLPAGAAAPSVQAASIVGCVQGTSPYGDPVTSCQLSTGAKILIFLPAGVNAKTDLVIFAHGYVAPGAPLEEGFNQLQLPGVSGIEGWVPGLVTGMGYAFAVTSYRVNGLAILDGVVDLADLRDAFITLNATQGRPAPPHTYVVGVSEGGLVATQAIEQRPDIFSGGLACCGPIGDFGEQIDYWGNFRVVYDYFFPKILTQYGGSAIQVTPDLMFAWTSRSVQPKVLDALIKNPKAADQLLDVTHAATDPNNPATIGQTVLDILVYNIFATNNGKDVLGGNPFNNQKPYNFYFGSSNDLKLNKGVDRFTADQAAINAIDASYQTTGKLQKPLVTMHTTLDPVVPYWHEVLYQLKNWASGTGAKHLNIPIVRYGHCNFTAPELVFGFGLMVFKATGAWPVGAQQALPNATLRSQFNALKANSDNIVTPAVE